METTIPNNVLIVGAGLSGLAAAEALKRRGIAATILEARDRVAEPWRRRHPALRLNIHRHFARLPGTRPPRADGAYLRRDSLVSYLERYARQIGVPIRFGVTVEGIERDACTWLLRTSAGTFAAAHVVFATGRDSIPYVPDWPGLREFESVVLHAADLGDVNRFDGKRILVVGAGNSGSDVLNHLTRHKPADVMISVRYGPAIVPNRVFGFPLHRAARLFQAMPVPLVDRAFALTQRLFFGDLSRHGMTTHPLGGGSRLAKDGTAFAIDDGFVAAIKSGRFKVAPAVSEFHGSQVIFKNGRSFEPDVVICATGYRTSLEPLVGHLGVLDPKATQCVLLENVTRSIRDFGSRASNPSSRVTSRPRGLQQNALETALLLTCNAPVKGLLCQLNALLCQRLPKADGAAVARHSRHGWSGHTKDKIHDFA